MVRDYNKVIRILSSVVFATTLTISSFIISKTNVMAEDANISVKAEEMLTVRVTVPTTWASGTSSSDGTFLRNMVSLDITTNNETGFTATMTSSNANTALVNSADPSYTIPTLTANSTKSSFPSNYWGYSTNDTSAGDSSSTYRPVAALGAEAPSYIANSAYSATTTSKNIYFGAKATTAKASGTYSKAVVFNVVTGISTDDTSATDVTPSDPATPSTDDDTTDSNPTYDSSLNETVYTSTSSTASTTTTSTTVTPGNTTSATYSSPAGVTTTTAINEGTPLATGLAITAGIAATTGIIFFIVAKRRKDDEEEEEY